MKEFVPYEKMSKKQKRAYDRSKRTTWQLSPVTRIAETDKKHYSRKIKHKKSGGDDTPPLFRFILPRSYKENRQTLHSVSACS